VKTVPEVKYFDENNKESGDSVVTGMQLETENANSVTGWQPHVNSEPIKDEWSDTDTDPSQGHF
jgi:hypothetical protein